MKTFAISLILTIFCFNSQAEYFTGEGEFLTVDSDSPQFVKKQLIYSAQKNILNEYISQLDLSPQEFWQGFENKITEKIGEKIEVLNEKLTKAREEKNFDSLIEYETKKRELSLKTEAIFLNKARIFTSYSVLDRSQSLSNPSLKFIKMKVKISKPRLKSFFYKLTKDDLNRFFENFYISVNFNNRSLFAVKSPSDSAIIDESKIEQIKTALTIKWEKFFTEELNPIVNKIIFTNESQNREIIQQIYLSPNPKEDKVEGEVGEDETGESEGSGAIGRLGGEEGVEVDDKTEQGMLSGVNIEEEGPKISERSSLFLKLEFDIEKVHFNELAQKGEYTYTGGMVLYDAEGGNIVFAHDFKKVEKEIFVTSKDIFYSSFATSLYNKPLSFFRKNKSHLAKYPSINNKMTVKVTKAANLNEIFTLNEFLNISGATHNFKSGSFISGNNEYFFDLLFNGNEDEALNKFRQWEGKKIGGNLLLTAKVESSSVELEISKDESELKEEEGRDEQTEKQGL